MLAKVLSAAVLGIDAYEVEVEVDLSPGLPAFTTVGLPDAAVKESRDRVAAAVKNTGFQFPVRKITVNLAPADVRKEGSAFDLPIAVGILFSTGQAPPTSEPAIFLGELSLDGGPRKPSAGCRLCDAARRPTITHRGISPTPQWAAPVRC